MVPGGGSSLWGCGESGEPQRPLGMREVQGTAAPPGELRPCTRQMPPLILRPSSGYFGRCRQSLAISIFSGLFRVPPVLEGCLAQTGRFLFRAISGILFRAISGVEPASHVSPTPHSLPARAPSQPHPSSGSGSQPKGPRGARSWRRPSLATGKREPDIASFSRSR